MDFLSPVSSGATSGVLPPPTAPVSQEFRSCCYAKKHGLYVFDNESSRRSHMQLALEGTTVGSVSNNQSNRACSQRRKGRGLRTEVQYPTSTYEPNETQNCFWKS